MIDTVLVTRENHVATLTFNRPDKMNALNREMAVQLETIIDQIKADHSIRALVLRGTGEVFMAGSDIYEFNKDLNMPPSEAIYFIRLFNASILTLREINKPVLASVHGLVTGAGLSLMLAADLVIASEETQFSLGFSRLATSPAGGITYTLPRLVGMKKAMELLFFSDNFNASTAASLGLVNWVVPPNELEVKTHHIVERMVHGPTLAYARTKQLVNASGQNKIQAQLELEAEAFVKSTQTVDFRNSVRAFINKREPEYEGR